MRKSLILTLLCVIFICSFSSEQDLLFGKTELNSTDERIFRSTIIGTSTTWVAISQINCDDPSSYGISLGPNIARKRDDAIRIAIMPGINYSNKALSYSVGLLFKVTELQNFELFTFACGMKGFKKPIAKFNFEGQLLYRISKKIQLGISLRAEQKKSKIIESGLQKMKYDDHLFITGDMVWALPNSNKIGMTLSTGLVYRNQASKTLYNGLVFNTSPLEPQMTNKLYLALGLRYRLPG